MAFVPAVCNTCGTVFPGVSIGGDGGARISFEGCQAGPCPRCGGMGAIRDGTYEIVANALRSIVNAAQGPDDLRRLSSMLQSAQREHAHASVLADQVEANSPELNVFAEWIRQYLVPKNSGEVFGLLSLLVACIALTLQIQSMSPNQQFDDKAVSAIVERAVASALVQTQQQAKKQAVRNPAVKNPKKIGRNDPCPCHSGKKYKMCCINRAKPTSQ